MLNFKRKKMACVQTNIIDPMATSQMNGYPTFRRYGLVAVGVESFHSECDYEMLYQKIYQHVKPEPSVTVST